MLTKDELARLTKLSCLALDSKEEIKFLDDLQKILSYIDQINLQAGVEEVSQVTKNINVFREDKVKPSEADVILKYAQNVKNGQFVMPKVLRKN